MALKLGEYRLTALIFPFFTTFYSPYRFCYKIARYRRLTATMRRCADIITPFFPAQSSQIQDDNARN